MHHFILYFDQSEDLRFGGPQGLFFFCFFSSGLQYSLAMAALKYWPSQQADDSL